MDRASGLAALNTVLTTRLASRTAIAVAVGVHPSQVSRIAAGHFKKLEGHALRVCKFAQNLLLQHGSEGNAQVEALGRKMLELVSSRPEVATALNVMLDAMLNQAPGGRLAGPRPG
ncbi:putative urease superfamily metal-dependent hydrolase [Xanthomonas sacchari]|uniref:hypothetical protein n=1 Tax=unclassified Xanthomonas TaxID=2643310 RepID=UPI00136A7CA5|nr:MULTISPECIES: hypothetical protein [unclassified Xanthomonas]MBB6368265.1 putative urease superfamily metal-dependent hydrolase [Xanthomonas sp. F10]